MTPKERRLVLNVAAATKGVGFTPQAAFLLLTVAESPGITASRAADLLGVTSAAISRSINTLRPYNVLRTDSDDPRRMELRLTEYGLDVINGMARGEAVLQGDDPTEGL